MNGRQRNRRMKGVEIITEMKMSGWQAKKSTAIIFQKILKIFIKFQKFHPKFKNFNFKKF